MVYDLFCALPGVHDLLVTVIGAMRKHCRQLGTSQGVPEPRSFAVRISAARQPAPTRPPHPAPRVVTIAMRPSCRDRTARTIRLILYSEKQNYFSQMDLTGIRRPRPVGQIGLRAARGIVVSNARNFAPAVSFGSPG